MEVLPEFEPCPKIIKVLVDKTLVTEYSYNMSKDEKLLKKAIHNPAGLSFNEFTTLLRRCDWIMDHQTGSHQIWYSPKKQRLSVQNRAGKAKGYQVKQFLELYREEFNNA